MTIDLAAAGVHSAFFLPLTVLSREGQTERFSSPTRTVRLFKPSPSESRHGTCEMPESSRARALLMPKPVIHNVSDYAPIIALAFDTVALRSNTANDEC